MQCLLDLFVQADQDLVRIPCLKCIRQVAYQVLYEHLQLPRVLCAICTGYMDNEPPVFIECDCGKWRMVAKKLPGHEVRFIRQVVSKQIDFPNGGKINRSSFWQRCREDYALGMIVIDKGDHLCLHKQFCKTCKAPRMDNGSKLCVTCWDLKKQRHIETQNLNSLG